MARKNDTVDFLMHTALKWNILRITYPNSDRNTFFRREANNFMFTATGGVKDIIKTMLQMPDKAAWAFDQNFYCIMGTTCSPDCEPMHEGVNNIFNENVRNEVKNHISNYT